MTDDTVDTVIIVHGTFDKDGQWWRPGGFFCENLDQRLEEKNCRARTWANIKPIPELEAWQEAEYNKSLKDVYVWDGRNSQISRKEAGHQLFQYLQDLVDKEFLTIGESYESANIHLVAHSHGGNVIIDALDRVSIHSKIASSLKSVTFLGTPFFHEKPRISMHEYPRTMSIFGFLTFAATVFALFNLFNFQDYIFFILALWWVLLAMSVAYTLSAETRDRHNALPVSISTNVIRSKYDEAIHLLRQAIELKITAVDVAKENSRINTAPPLHQRFIFLRNYSDLLSSCFSLFSIHSYTFGLLFVVMGFPILILIALDRAVFRIYNVLISVVSRIALVVGFRSIAEFAIGNDAAHAKITGVSDCKTPIIMFPREIVLSDKIEEELLASSLDMSNSSVRDVYDILGKHHMQEIKSNLLSALKDTFTGSQTVHCQYQRNDAVIDLIAELISETYTSTPNDRFTRTELTGKKFGTVAVIRR